MNDIQKRNNLTKNTIKQINITKKTFDNKSNNKFIHSKEPDKQITNKKTTLKIMFEVLKHILLCIKNEL